MIATRTVSKAGSEATGGTYHCLDCGLAIHADAGEILEPCHGCGGGLYRRGSIFEQPTLSTESVEVDDSDAGWLAEARAAALEEAGPVLAFADGSGYRTIALERGWTHVGRTSKADLRLDDPTVSRRHALIVRTEGDELRVLDDRSLNGIFLNGQRVDWGELRDGDELRIGRYRLHVLAPVAESTEPVPA